MSALLPAESTAFVTVCKKAFKRTFDENDLLLIGNGPALRKGLEALLKEDASDRTRAEELWADAIAIIRAEADNETSPAAQGTMAVQDDFYMEGIPVGL